MEQRLAILVLLVLGVGSVSGAVEPVFTQVILQGGGSTGNATLLVTDTVFYQFYNITVTTSVYVTPPTTYQPQVNILFVHGAENYRNNSWFIALQDPFYGYFSRPIESMVCGGEIHITHPVNGETYYDNTQNITVTVSGMTPAYCRYRTNGNAWNTYDCSEKRVTYPDGTVTLDVEAWDGGCSASDTSVFFVEMFRSRLAGVRWGMMGLCAFIGAGCVYFMILKGKKKRR